MESWRNRERNKFRPYYIGRAYGTLIFHRLWAYKKKYARAEFRTGLLKKNMLVRNSVQAY